MKTSKTAAMDSETMNRILEKTAAYCEKLKKSAFYFICKEEIVENREPPGSIVGFPQLKEIARKLGARLQLSLEIDFDEKRRGLRFPTRVSMREKYKGGRIVSMHKGSQGWLRTRMEFDYSDYRFFSVQVDVTIDRNGNTD